MLVSRRQARNRVVSNHLMHPSFDPFGEAEQVHRNCKVERFCGRDVVAIRVEDVATGGYTADRATVRQKKTGRPDQI